MTAKTDQRKAASTVIAECTSEVGISMVEIHAITGGSKKALSLSLARMVLNSEAFAIGSHRDMRYFATREQRDQAAGAYERFLNAVRAQRKEKRRASRLTNRARYLEKRKRNRPDVRPGTTVSRVLGMIRGVKDPLGISYEDLSLIEAKWTAVSKGLETLVMRGMVFQCGYRNWRRFFPTAEARDAAAPELARMQAETAEKVKAAASAARWAAQKAARPPKEPKAPKPEKPKAAPKVKAVVQGAPAPKYVCAPVVIKTKHQAEFKSAQPIIPAGLKVTVCPPCQPRSFAPPPWFKGEFQTEWAQLRASKEAV
jgi:hypothetical protein